jgi:hypothetical protein
MEKSEKLSYMLIVTNATPPLACPLLSQTEQGLDFVKWVASGIKLGERISAHCKNRLLKYRGVIDRGTQKSGAAVPQHAGARKILDSQKPPSQHFLAMDYLGSIYSA